MAATERACSMRSIVRPTKSLRCSGTPTRQTSIPDSSRSYAGAPRQARDTTTTRCPAADNALATVSNWTPTPPQFVKGGNSCEIRQMLRDVAIYLATENRFGLVKVAELTPATGTAERGAAVALGLQNSDGHERITLGRDTDCNTYVSAAHAFQRIARVDDQRCLVDDRLVVETLVVRRDERAIEAMNKSLIRRDGFELNAGFRQLWHVRIAIREDGAQPA